VITRFKRAVSPRTASLASRIRAAAFTYLALAAVLSTTATVSLVKIRVVRESKAPDQLTAAVGAPEVPAGTAPVPLVIAGPAPPIVVQPAPPRDRLVPELVSPAARASEPNPPVVTTPPESSPSMPPVPRTSTESHTSAPGTQPTPSTPPAVNSAPLSGPLGPASQVVANVGLALSVFTATAQQPQPSAAEASSRPAADHAAQHRTPATPSQARLAAASPRSIGRRNAERGAGRSGPMSSRGKPAR
jgi:hypothetical protein